MDYEKKYKEAMARMESWARGEHPECFSEAQKAAEFVFPELKEPNDERIKKELLNYIKQSANSATLDVNRKKFSEMADWIEKQGTGEWSEADEKHLEKLCTALSCDARMSRTVREDHITWLKSLKPRPNYIWTEDDEKYLVSCLWHVSNSVSNGKCTDSQCQLTDWLKSIKTRSVWKPSEESLTALKYYVDNTRDGEIELLYNDLKKL